MSRRRCSGASGNKISTEIGITSAVDDSAGRHDVKAGFKLVEGLQLCPPEQARHAHEARRCLKGERIALSVGIHPATSITRWTHCRAAGVVSKLAATGLL